jgi:hypothetical protein
LIVGVACPIALVMLRAVDRADAIPAALSCCACRNSSSSADCSGPNRTTASFAASLIHSRCRFLLAITSPP